MTGPATSTTQDTRAWNAHPDRVGTALGTIGKAAGMSDADIADATELLTPGSSRHLLDDPGYYVVPAAIVAALRDARLTDDELAAGEAAWRRWMASRSTAERTGA